MSQEERGAQDSRVAPCFADGCSVDAFRSKPGESRRCCLRRRIGLGVDAPAQFSQVEIIDAHGRLGQRRLQAIEAPRGATRPKSPGVLTVGPGALLASLMPLVIHEDVSDSDDWLASRAIRAPAEVVILCAPAVVLLVVSVNRLIERQRDAVMSTQWLGLVRFSQADSAEQRVPAISAVSAEQGLSIRQRQRDGLASAGKGVVVKRLRLLGREIDAIGDDKIASLPKGLVALQHVLSRAAIAIEKDQSSVRRGVARQKRPHSVVANLRQALHALVGSANERDRRAALAREALSEVENGFIIRIACDGEAVGRPALERDAQQRSPQAPRRVRGDDDVQLRPRRHS